MLQVAVFNINTKDKWIFEDIEVSAEEIPEMSINSKILAILSENMQGQNSSTLVVYSLETKKVMLKEYLSKFLNLVIDSSSAVLFLLFEDKVEVLNFDDVDGSVSRFSCSANHGDEETFTNFVSPYIVFGSSSLTSGCSMDVWRVDEQQHQVELHKHVPQTATFPHKANGDVLEGASMDFVDAIYVSSLFVISTTARIEHGDIDEDNPESMCILWILNDD